MGRAALLIVAMALVLLVSPNAYAICQKCNTEHTLNAMCWTIGACD